MALSPKFASLIKTIGLFFQAGVLSLFFGLKSSMQFLKRYCALETMAFRKLKLLWSNLQLLSVTSPFAGLVAEFVIVEANPIELP